jgi:hypothetical protein
MKPMASGCYCYCIHPEAKPGEQCILNDGDECVIREPIMTSMQISRDTLEALREFGYPAEKAVIRLLEMTKS